MLTELRVAMTWLHARVTLARRSEEGAVSAIEWLLIIIAVIGIAGLAIAAVRNYVTNKSNELGNQ